MIMLYNYYKIIYWINVRDLIQRSEVVKCIIINQPAFLRDKIFLIALRNVMACDRETCMRSNRVDRRANAPA